MVSSTRSRSLCLAAAGLCCHGPNKHLAAHGFGVSPASSAGTRLSHSRGAVRPMGTRVSSTVDVERRSGVAETARASHETLPRRISNPETILLETTATAAAAASAADVVEPRTGSIGGDVASAVEADSRSPTAGAGASVPAAAVATQESLPRRNKRRNAKEPEVRVEGDLLVNTPKMVGLVWSSLVLNAAYLLQALSTVSSPVEALWTALGAFVGYTIADLVSGVFHWSVDNYGDGRTPVFGAVIEAFQGHHVSPWTITHRPFENNVHKIAYAVLPLLALLRLVDPGPAGVAFGVTFLVGSLMSNEFHRFAHMLDPPAPVKALQGLGVTVSRKEHGRHHSSPFEDKYCIVTGICNGPLDHFRVFRFLERVVFQLNGVEPIAWKLDPAVKKEALSTGWLPFSGTTTDASAEDSTAA